MKRTDGVSWERRAAILMRKANELIRIAPDHIVGSPNTYDRWMTEAAELRKALHHAADTLDPPLDPEGDR